MMRIMAIIYEFPPLGGGGGSAARDICQGLAKRGHEIHVLTAHMKDLPRQENSPGVSVFRIPSGRKEPYRAGLSTMAGFVAAGLVAGLSHVRKWRPDIIHVHFAVPSGPVAWALSKLSKAPYVLTAHLGDVPRGVPEKTDKWFRWIYPFTPKIWRDASRVIAVSEHTRQLALQNYPVNIQVIPNGVNLEQLNPGEIRAGAPPRIIFAGRFMPQKNPLQLVQTLASLKQLDWECIMLGDGALRDQVAQQVKELGLEERFSLPGWVSPEEVIQWLGRSDILFMPSLSEGLPVVGVQALAMGLALVASRVGGFVDLVDDGKNGYLVAPEKPDGYQRALVELLSAPDRLQSFRERSREKAACFDIDHVVASYERLFLEVIEEGK
ncbi:MAG: glycosyltransferase family 4 protein [Anaerolineales bacterium]|nr:glycosyltransferase family 4 protein [Anaerolineales bacterium]